MRHPRSTCRALTYACLCLPAALLGGCSDNGTVSSPEALGGTTLVRGNWQVSSSTAAAARLPVLSGVLSAQAGDVTGIFHTQSANACVGPATSFTLAGSADAQGHLSLSGSVAGGTLNLTGTLAEDGRSLVDASYTVLGGSCALAQRIQATVQVFTPVSGSYTGSFADIDGQIAQVTADLSQSTTPDANGDFMLAGTATVANNPCFPGPIPISNTQVTGGTFTFTYASNGSSVTARGTFSPDASTLSVTDWTASGACGADTGIPSTMTRH